MSLFLQVVGGAFLGFVFLWLCVVLGTWLGERSTDPGISALRARLEIAAIRRRAVRQMMETSRRMDRPSVSTSQGYEIIEAEDEQP